MSDAATALLRGLRRRRNARHIAGMRRFGINSAHEQLGVGMTELRRLARPHRRDHALALELWATGVMEAMILAMLVEDPREMSAGQAERWVRGCDYWAMTDALASLVDRAEFAVQKAQAWSHRRAEFVKRTGFAVMAGLAVHRKELPDAAFLALLPEIERAADDDRNFVRKAVNWALRQIGKRNATLRRAAIACARRILRRETRAARWIARDALRELQR